MMLTRILLITLFTLLLITACGKNKIANDDVVVIPIQGLVSHWEWKMSSGGFGGGVITPESEGYTQELWFTSDSMAIIFKNKVPQWVTSFSIEMRSWIVNHDTVSMIVYDNGIPDQHFEISDDGDTLFLFDNVYDGFAHTYINLIQFAD